MKSDQRAVCLVVGSGAVARDLFLLIENRRGDVLAAQETRIGRRDVHGDIVNELLEIAGARDEVGLAVDFHHDAQLPARVNVRANEALMRGAPGLVARRGDAPFAQDHFALGQIALGFHEGLLAFHHARAGALAQFFY